MAHPDWALKYKRPGTELRFINGRYCLYECKCIYDKEKKRNRKITGKYLGSITEADGFKPSKKRLMEEEIARVNSGTAKPADHEVGEVKECGLSWVIEHAMKEICDAIREIFPAEADRLIALAYCRLRYQSPMKDVVEDYSDSMLSAEKGAYGLSPNALTSFYREIGGKRPSMVKYMKMFTGGTGDIVFDGSDLLSASRKMTYPKVTKTKTGAFDEAIDIMMVYSLENRLPAYFRVMPGNIKDVKAFKLCMEESGAKDGVAIIDKTFPSKSNLEFLDNEKIRYIASLRRNTAGLDYTPFSSRDNKGVGGIFMYEGRVIMWSGQKIGGRDVYVYMDEQLRIDENKDYLNRVLSGKFDNYTMDGYHEHALMFGTLALVTNAGRDAQRSYESYKTRCEVEQAIDVFKNNFDADRTYMQDEFALETHLFINFIAMQWYYIIRRRLVDRDLLGKYSPMGIVKMLSRIRKVYVNGEWKLAEMTKKEKDLLMTLGFDIT